MSLLSLQNALLALGFRLSLIMTDMTTVAQARNLMAKHIAAKADKYDLVMWLDSDQTLSLEQFLMLLQIFHALKPTDILSPKILGKALDAPYTNGMWVTEDQRFNLVPPTATGLIEVDAVGFGCVLMCPAILARMQEAHPHQFCPELVNDVTGIVGEDVTWCWKLKKLAPETRFFYAADICIGHVGAEVGENVVKLLKGKGK